LRRNRYDYRADGLAIKKRNLRFLTDPRFSAAWDETRQVSVPGFRKGKIPDIRWRTLICIQAAQQALLTAGDFVECGVNTGLMSGMICRYLDFARINRHFFLFDTFAGIPLAGLDGKEAAEAAHINKAKYCDCYAVAQENFRTFPNVKLMRGALPDTLSEITGRKIAYLLIDLNSATYEMQVIDRIWDQLSPGATIVLDDYGHQGHPDQFVAWNDFAAKVGHPIFQLPTGQGLMFRTDAARAIIPCQEYNTVARD